MPWGLKNKTFNLHTTTTEVKIDHTIRPLLTHTVPLELPQEDNHLLSGSEGLILPPLPRVDHEKVPVLELLLYDWHNMNKCTTKINKYD